MSSGKITVWVPGGMEPDIDTTIWPMHWVKVKAMANADIILCKAGIQTASLSTKLCANLYRQRMIDLEWMSSGGLHGHSVDHPPRAKGSRRPLVVICFTPSAKEKHNNAVSMLERFSANAIMHNPQKKRWSTCNLKFHHDLEAFFGAVTKPTMSASSLAFTFIVCMADEVHELRELASFKFGCRKDSSLIERSVNSFHAFVACF